MDDKKDQLLAALACNRDVPNTQPTYKQDCSDVVNISVFFDGTGNNKDEDDEDHKWSNVARIWLSAMQRKDKTNYPIYVAGVGTPFNGTATGWIDGAIVKVQDELLGNALGAGGSRRTEFGQSNVNDTLRQVLMANAQKLGGPTKAYADKSKGQSFADIGKALAAHRLIKVINLSIFGFSRGAALARAFCNDFLKDCTVGKDGQLTYNGYPIRIHFMGLFDTVASYGVPAANLDWPWTEKTLKIPGAVERCVHFVAAHELRFSFPVDLICQHGKLMPNWREEVYPGAHADVGGGYLPSEQGIANNYSRIPMRDMMREAATSGVRMLSYGDLEKDPKVKALFTERFAIQPKTENDYGRYMSGIPLGGSVQDTMAAHMKALYSAWGTMSRQGVPTPYQRQTGSSAKALGHPSMAQEVRAYRGALRVKQLSEKDRPVMHFVSSTYAQTVRPEAWRLAAWDSEASAEVLAFIKNHVHDSKVDFVMNAEPFSYFSPRGMAESSRNVLAQGLQWLGDSASQAAAAVGGGAIKVYHVAEGVVVETWREGKLVATQTYKVGEKIVLDSVQAGEKYAIEVYQTSKTVAISAVKSGEKFVVTSVDTAQKAAADALQATRDRAQKLAAQAQRAAKEGLNAVGQEIDAGMAVVEEGWKAAKVRLGLP